ncbi:hypothetical protein LPJ53_006248 [Coemansia erecta]|uniref:ABC transporter domain-containing protein n=1 Tax=Coemansia erecta TaxID=147472 RepID=A0A9W8CPI4_9FUNG|nr:hypothetical protein LPJ53_006248 [Coemansia erecta]
MSYMPLPSQQTLPSSSVPQRDRAQSVGIMLPSSPTVPLLPSSAPETPSSDAFYSSEKPDGQHKQQYAIGRLLLRRLRRIGAVLHASSNKRIGLWCLLLLIAKLLGEVVYYYAGRLPSEFYRVLGDRDVSSFYPLLFRCILVVTVAGACHAALELGGGLLGTQVRQTLTEYTHARYIDEKTLHGVATQGLVDNPDQRVTQDIERLSTTLATVLPELLLAPPLVVYYTVKCWNISGFLGPLSIYLYFIVGALASRMAMPPVVKQVYRLERAEGDFRFLSLRVVEYAESIAFFSGQQRERKAADSSLNGVISVQKQLLWKQFWLGLVTQVFAYLGSTVSYVIIAVPIFLGRYDDRSGGDLSSVISMNAFVSLYLIYRFSLVIEQAKRLADVAGFGTRIVQLWEAADWLDRQASEQAVRNTEGKVVTQGLCVGAPRDGRLLVSNLDLQLGPGDSLLITGPNGVGKTSLLRVLAGLWPPASGTLSLPAAAAHAVFFLPQQAYMVAGSLREQLSYPWTTSGQSRVCSDGELARVLALVGLEHVPRMLEGEGEGDEQQRQLGVYDRWVSAQTWARVLSPGERQRMSIGRVLFWRPTFAILDECTSSLDVAAEERVYAAMQEAGITVVSVGHRAELQRFHRRRLHLLADGSHVLE